MMACTIWKLQKAMYKLWLILTTVILFTMKYLMPYAYDYCTQKIKFKLLEVSNHMPNQLYEISILMNEKKCPRM